jgi:hypothetical protein
MLDVQSTPARVAWVGPVGGEPEVLSQAAKDSTYRVRYLGASGGETLLLIVGQGQALTIRIPTTDVEIDTCRGTNSTRKQCHVP